MDICRCILEGLSDGGFHSGQQFADSLGVSRTTIANHIQKLQQDYHLDIHAVSGRGYRIPGGLELLDEERILAELLDDQRHIGQCRIHQKLDSTNRHLLESHLCHADKIDVCLAEMQTAGRGRRGRQWVSPYGRNIYLSLARNLNLSMQQVGGLSIAIGTAIADCLSDLGAPDLTLKWPNDIHWQGQKLAGLLIELKGETEGPLKIVVGVGVNLHLPETERNLIDQPITDLQTIMGDSVPSRNTIAARLVCHINAAMQEFEQAGMTAFVNRWKQYDSYLGQEVVITSPASSISGTYQGISASGALELLVDGEIKQFTGGEISLRSAGESGA